MGCSCTVFFLVGLPFCTRLGGAILDVTDHFAIPYTLLLGCFVELCMFHLDFGWHRLARAIRNATVSAKRPRGRQLSERYWQLCLRVFAPLLTLGLLPPCLTLT